VIKAIKEPVSHAVGFGSFYQSRNEPNKAIEEFKKALNVKELDGGGFEIPAFASEGEEKNLQIIAVGSLFDLAIGKENWELAKQLTSTSKNENIDGCEGYFFEARTAIAKKDYKAALEKLDICLTRRPVFSQAYILRSSAQAALGNMILAVEDAQKAASLNPLNGFVAERLALTLCQRNEQLGGEVSADQTIEARDSLIMALRLNPGKSELQSFYAEYISEDNPDDALAIRQRLQKLVPSFQNAMLLGNMAMRMASKETNEEKKNVYFGLAAKAFGQALAIEPQNQSALHNFAEYYRLTGQEDKAQKLLEKSSDEKLMFTHYLRLGQYEKAQEVAEQLYNENPADTNAVKQLALVSERTFNQEGVKKFSEEILNLEDTKGNHLYQISSFLKVGLTKEAEHKLASFKEKYPDEPASLLLGAWLSMRKGQLEEALDLVNQNLQIDRNNASAWRLRGEINYFLANHSEAVRDLKKSKAILDTGNTRIALAKAYLKTGLQEDAITELKDTINQPEAPAEARQLLEQTYVQTNRKRELVGFYKETLKEFPDSVVWLNKAGTFSLEQKDYNSGEQLFKKAWEKSRESGKVDFSAFDGYLYSLVLGGKFDKVFEVARKHTDGDLAAIAFFRMAEAKMKLGDEESAKQYCRKAVDKAGTKEIVLANILREINSLFGAEEMEKYCLEKLKENPDSLGANTAMYESMRIQKRYNKAIDYLDKCIDIVGADSPLAFNYMISKAGILQMVYDRTSDKNYMQRCVELYKSLLIKMPNNPSILNNLAYMLVESGYMLDKALEYAEAAHEAKPNRADYMDTYAYVLYKNGKYEDAAKFIQAALQQFENDKMSAPWEVYKHLGDIKETLQQNGQALAAYKQALDAGADTVPEKIKKEIEQAIERVSK
jgi:tetratricopeptide (TPR) repeat protein